MARKKSARARFATTIGCALLLFIALPLAQGAAQAPKSRSGTQVYLFRGWMNVFSMGMDEFGTQLARRGIPASVYNHMSWSGAADEAARNYKSGRTRTIIAIGHSMGAGAVVSMVEQLGAQDIPVVLAVTLDGNPAVIRVGRVNRFVNLYIANGGLGGGVMTKGPRFSGSLTNINVAKMPDMGHMNIDKQAAVHKMLHGYISQAMSAGAPAAPQGAPSAGPKAQPGGSVPPATTPASGGKPTPPASTPPGTPLSGPRTTSPAG